jgi:hypothetical protein
VSLAIGQYHFYPKSASIWQPLPFRSMAWPSLLADYQTVPVTHILGSIHYFLSFLLRCSACMQRVFGIFGSLLCASGGFSVNNVDIYNGITGSWKLAFLSAARSLLVATSLPDDGLAFFAGGVGAPCAFFKICFVPNIMLVVFKTFLTVHTSFIGSTSSVKGDVLDIYNATANEWTVETLAHPRGSMAATTLPRQGLVLFAGGGGVYVERFVVSGIIGALAPIWF